MTPCRGAPQAKKFAEAGPMKEVTKKLKVDMPAQEKARPLA